jgi:hypothetical protein
MLCALYKTVPRTRISGRMLRYDRLWKTVDIMDNVQRIRGITSAIPNTTTLTALALSPLASSSGSGGGHARSGWRGSARIPLCTRRVRSGTVTSATGRCSNRHLIDAIPQLANGIIYISGRGGVGDVDTLRGQAPTRKRHQIGSSRQRWRIWKL